MTFLFYAHSGLRYLVLLVGIVAVLHAAYALARHVPQGKVGRVTTAIYTGLLDLMVLLGVGLLIGGIWYPALMGHLTLMLLAVLVAHATSVLARNSEDARRATKLRLAGIALSLLLVVGGILAIGRSVFGSAAPTVFS